MPGNQPRLGRYRHGQEMLSASNGELRQFPLVVFQTVPARRPIRTPRRVIARAIHTFPTVIHRRRSTANVGTDSRYEWLPLLRLNYSCDLAMRRGVRSGHLARRSDVGCPISAKYLS